ARPLSARIPPTQYLLCWTMHRTRRRPRSGYFVCDGAQHIPQLRVASAPFRNEGTQPVAGPGLQPVDEPQCGRQLGCAFCVEIRDKTGRSNELADNPITFVKRGLLRRYRGEPRVGLRFQQTMTGPASADLRFE